MLPIVPGRPHKEELRQTRNGNNDIGNNLNRQADGLNIGLLVIIDRALAQEIGYVVLKGGCSCPVVAQKKFERRQRKVVAWDCDFDVHIEVEFKLCFIRQIDGNEEEFRGEMLELRPFLAL